MGDFFRGWRRKIGCVTLMMALVGMAGWVRSHTIEDSFPLIGSEIRSREGFVEQTVTLFKRQPNSSSAVFHQSILRRLPYWSITIPLTLISFWFLLSKHGKSTQLKISEPVANEGA